MNTSKLNLDALLAFMTVARERNMRKAALALHISQPPLSRKIRQLEENLGLVLFMRHTDGMALTEEGIEVLAIIQPLMEMANEIGIKLNKLGNDKDEKYSLGLTTAFEQAIFAPHIKKWGAEFGKNPRLVRKESPRLISDICRDKLDAALVALPVETYNLFVLDMNYSEKLCAVIPESWPESSFNKLDLKLMDGKPMFWFQRKQNPLYFDHMLAIFNESKFSPIFMEEPLEHDVLLARISFGEAWALLPESFTSLPRAGTSFIPVNDNIPLRQKLGFVCKDEKILNKFANS